MSIRGISSVLGLMLLAATLEAQAFPHDHQIGLGADSGMHHEHEPGRPPPVARPPHVPGPHAPWHHVWGNGDPHYFPYHDWYYWHQGYWHHGWYGARFGWWWVASGVWFFYPAPVYPYPNPYVPSGFTAPPPPAGSTPPATQYWYFCPASNGYYPYVAECPSGWQQVVPTAPDAGVPGG